jgi:hypothetical protein
VAVSNAKPHRLVNSQSRVHRLLGCIVNYSYVHTDENVADILTKVIGLWSIGRPFKVGFKVVSLFLWE